MQLEQGVRVTGCRGRAAEPGTHRRGAAEAVSKADRILGTRPEINTPNTNLGPEIRACHSTHPLPVGVHRTRLSSLSSTPPSHSQIPLCMLVVRASPHLPCHLPTVHARP